MEPVPIIDIENWLPTTMSVVRSTRHSVVMRRSAEGKALFLVKTYTKQLGELRSELIASLLGRAAGIPVQWVQFCTIPQHREIGFEKNQGIFAKFVITRGRGRREDMIHGAQILSQSHIGYAVLDERPTAYNIPNIHAALLAYGNDKNCKQALLADFVMMIFFDALIGGTDRHHWNWAVVEENGQFKRLAALFDNGISLLWNFENADVKARVVNDLHRYAKGGQSVMRISENHKGTPFDLLKTVLAWPECNSEILARIKNSLANLSPAKRKHAIVDRVTNHASFGTANRQVLGWIHKYVNIRYNVICNIVSSHPLWTHLN